MSQNQNKRRFQQTILLTAFNLGLKVAINFPSCIYELSEFNSQIIHQGLGVAKNKLHVAG